MFAYFLSILKQTAQRLRVYCFSGKKPTLYYTTPPPVSQGQARARAVAGRARHAPARGNKIPLGFARRDFEAGFPNLEGFSRPADPRLACCLVLGLLMPTPLPPPVWLTGYGLYPVGTGGGYKSIISFQRGETFVSPL